MNDKDFEDFVAYTEITNEQLKKLPIIPFGPRVVVKLEKVEEKTKNGIVLPEEYTRREQDCVCTGEILGYGITAGVDLVQSRKCLPPIGSKIKFVKYAGIGEKIGVEEFRYFNDDDIIGAKNPYYEPPELEKKENPDE